jgi:xylan 1,4-beta-xylosidase
MRTAPPESFMAHRVVIATLLAVTALAAQPAPAERVTIRVDASQRLGPMTPAWAWFGYDEPNYTYMKDGGKLLSELAALSPVRSTCARTTC